MHIFKKIHSTAILLLVITFSASSFSITESYSRAVRKAIEAVEEAEEHDWKTLAQSAEICFKKKENTEQALEWINKSITLNEDPYNLEIKGDYYRSKGEKMKAIECYNNAIIAGKKQDFWKDNGKLQQKIWDLR